MVCSFAHHGVGDALFHQNGCHCLAMIGQSAQSNGRPMLHGSQRVSQQRQQEGDRGTKPPHVASLPSELSYGIHKGRALSIPPLQHCTR